MFPTCPACKQSVLDDDAEYCPFCGASMKGGKPGKAPPPKPVARPAAAPKESPAAAAPAAAPIKTPAKPAPAKGKDDDDDDPFGVGAASASRAIALSPRPMKGKTTRLVCPMCETQGFAGPEAAGKEVKCCNEKCPLPIFTAPKAETTNGSPMPKVVPVAKKSSLPLVMTAVAMVALAAGSVWYFVLNDPSANIKPAPQAPTNHNPVPVTKLDPNGTDKDNGPKKVEKTAQEKALELRSQILPVMVEVSRSSEKNRSKPYCRRLSAEAYVEAGDLKAARDNLDQLLKLDQKLRFHQVPPLTQIVWHELAAGNAEPAKTALEEAWKAAAELPDFGRLTFDATTDLAALLVVNGRTDDAKSLMQKHALPPGSGGMLAALTRQARLLHSFNLDEAAASQPIVSWKSPQWAVTTITLVLRGQANKGLEWAKLAPDVETKADCLAAWGDAVVVAPKPVEDPVSAAVRSEPPALQARVWARVATARAVRGQKETATQALSRAVAALKSIALPSEFVLPEMRELTRLELPNAVPARLNALAAVEVALAQTRLDQTVAAAESLAAALQHLRGHAPSPVSAQRHFDAATNDVTEVRAQLKKALDLKTDDQIRQALNNYRAKCRAALDAANARFALQTEILKAAVDWPLLDAVWHEATARSAESTPEESREDFLKTNLSVRLGQRLRAAGQANLARQCETAATNGDFTDPRDELERETAEAVAKGDVMAVAKRLATYQPTKSEGQRTSTEDSDWPLLWALRLSGRLSKSGKGDKALELIAACPDILWREEGYELAASFAARNLTAAESLWKKYRSSGLTPTEKIAIFRGLCAGLSTVDAAKP